VLKYSCPFSVIAKINESVELDICNSELIWNIILFISLQIPIDMEHNIVHKSADTNRRDAAEF
jgi:hypothetical protein